MLKDFHSTILEGSPRASFANGLAH